ncbi:MAG: secondary thiamine-phosphate synthase enzyme YjbQ [Bacteroidales bacterium]|nr:secondary thiamine-phosphate synthase enzyme YjbQ [Bacteroidales bacterium]MCF8333082.1 secondary thiamine-phosphate synthase enzyme YjbQ [Bacteroidales bacterium]
MQKNITISTGKREALYDITKDVMKVVKDVSIDTGVVNVYVQGATAGIMIQENWDQSVQNDVINLLQKHIPKGIWEHDMQDGNADAHLKAGLVGPSESIPIINGHIGLSTWQNIFLCEFDGPRTRRNIVVTLTKSA